MLAKLAQKRSSEKDKKKIYFITSFNCKNKKILKNKEKLNSLLLSLIVTTKFSVYFKSLIDLIEILSRAGIICKWIFFF